MHFLIIRRLRNSELGWFAEFRRQGRETAKQRGINFDAEVVERVFPSASSEKDIQLSLSFRGDNGIKTELHPLKRQHKNWRLVGTKIEDEIFGSVDPEDLFLLSIDAIGDVPRCQFSIHKPESPMGKFILTQPQTLALANNSMIAIHSSELGNIEKKLVEHDSELYHTLSAMKYDNQMDENINEDDLLQIPDAGRLIDALSNIGYSLNAAVSDIIDNSIEAGAKNINITFPDPNKYGRILSIADDGSGMTPKKLVNALCIGSSRSYSDSDLGKFGMGLKTASLSQAKTVIVSSKTNNYEMETLAWDKNELKKSGEWKLIRPSIRNELKPLLHEPLTNNNGTVVLWDDMVPPKGQRAIRKKASEDQISIYGHECHNLARHVGTFFHRFLEGKAKGKTKINITLNGMSIKPLDPLALWHVKTQTLPVESISIPTAQNSSQLVEIRPVIVPGTQELDKNEREIIGFWGNWQSSQGFYFYRNDRLIQAGTWCGLWTEDPHFQLLRVGVDITSELDEAFDINVAKAQTLPPAIFTMNIKKMLTHPRSLARKAYSPKGRSEKKAKKQHTKTKPDSNPQTAVTNKKQAPISTQANEAKDSQGILLLGTNLNGQLWRHREDAIGNDIIEIDTSIPEAKFIIDSISEDQNASEAFASLIKSICTEANKLKIIGGWKHKNGQ